MHADPDTWIDPDAVLADLDALVAIPSISGSAAELDIQRYLGERWRSCGLEVDEWEIDVARTSADPAFPGMEVERGAALGVLACAEGSGSGPTLLLNGHTDVVPPGDLGAWRTDPFTPVHQGRRLIGRGACDMKAGLVAAWHAVRAVREHGPTLRGTVALAAVSGEEDGGLGTFALIERLRLRGIAPTMCVIPEPTDLDLVPANGGALTFRLTVHGAATHASRRTEGVSALEKLVPIMEALAGLERTRNAAVDPLMARWPIAYPLSIGVVRTGDWASTVPDLLVAEGRYGVALGETIDEARRQFEDAVKEASAQDPWLREHPVEVTWWGGQFASGRTDPAHPLMASLADAHVAAGGSGQPEVYGGPYGSDLRLLVAAGIPTVQYGPGDSMAAHAPNEWVDVDDVLLCARALTRLIVDVCT